MHDVDESCSLAMHTSNCGHGINQPKPAIKFKHG